MQHLALFLLFAVTPILFLLTGEWVFEAAFAALTKREQAQAEETSPQLLLVYVLGGLLVTLSLVLALACTGLPLSLAVLAALALPLLRRNRAALLLHQFRPKLSLNFLLWSAASILLGTSLIGTADGYQTAWRNNYADFAWHMGTIASFTFGENFPPQNQIFPPLTLSYPFFINLWTATYWVFDAEPAPLGWIVLYQWLFLWTAVYVALDGNRWRVLPWAVLLGGGSYDFVFRTLNSADYLHLAKLGPYAHDLLNNGYPWVPFLDSVWVPQRQTQLGAPLMLTSLLLAHGALFGAAEEDKEKRTFFAGLLLGLSPLANTHFFLTAACYLGLLFVVRAVPAENRRAGLKLLVLFCLGLSPAVLATPWVIGKYGIVTIAGGWMQSDVYSQAGLAAAMAAGAKLWLANGALWLTLTALVVVLGRRFAAGAVFAVLFLAGNIVQIAVWNWDEIKIFLALFLVSISLWQTVPGSKAKLAHWLLAFLVVPASVELGVILSRYETFTIYNRAEIRDAEIIRNTVPPGAIIAAKPDHNSPVTLTGRKLYYGYEGTLSSHGIPFEERQKIQNDFSRLKNCRALPEKPFCPDYLFWSWREKDFWKRPEPGEGVTPTDHYFLYRFR